MRRVLRSIAFFCATPLGALLCLRCGSPDDASVPAEDAGLGGETAAPTRGDASTSSPADGGSTSFHPPADASNAPDVGVPVEAGSPGKSDIQFAIDATKTHPISPYVYGLNDGSHAAAVHGTIVRTGGNRLTAYNWENNASNAGSDYIYESDDYLCANAACGPTNDTAGAFDKAMVEQAKAAGAAALLTIPIVDYVAADKCNCSLSHGATPDASHLKQNKPAKGSAFAYPPSTSDDFVYQDERVSYLAKQGEPGATILYLLDNEPDLWSSTHPEVHPTAVTYAELTQRCIDYAKAIKNVVPDAQVWGPVNYGWAGYVNLQGASDAKTDGDFVSFWLGKMHDASTAAGGPIVAGLDLHWYTEVGDTGATTNGGKPGSDCRINANPAGKGFQGPSDCTGADAIAGMAAAREQATRSLWDSSYVENSWISASLGNKPINLIPLMQGKIAAKSPGMGLSISEWNYGGGTDISGTIVSADALGIFGAYGLSMAMMWPFWTDASGNVAEDYTYAAFDVFRNYDGAGAAFGDTSIQATTSDVPESSVFASISSDEAARLVIVAINKATSDKVAGIAITHSTIYTKASVYTVTAAGGAKVVPAAGIEATATNAFAYTMPAQSVSVLVPTP